jgi:hypothetical protein
VLSITIRPIASGKSRFAMNLPVPPAGIFTFLSSPGNVVRRCCDGRPSGAAWSITTTQHFHDQTRAHPHHRRLRGSYFMPDWQNKPRRLR